jgi:hypothetical protein
MRQYHFSLALCGLLFSGLTHATDFAKPEVNKNPFVKQAAPVALPMNLPSNLGSNLPMSAPRGLPVEEMAQPQIDWQSIKVVGYIGNNIILRVYDKNSQNEPQTILTTFNTKFLLRGNYYSLKNDGKIFTVLRNNKPVHRLTFESNAVHLIPRNNLNNSSSNSSNPGNNSTATGNINNNPTSNNPSSGGTSVR